MKVIGIGTDIVSITRIEGLWQEYKDHFAKRILSPAELVDLEKSNKKMAFLAKRYAAKEALAKALGTGFQPNGLLLTEISVRNNELGRPYFEFLGRTKHEVEKRQVTESHLSLSDEAEFAVAFVILL